MSTSISVLAALAAAVQPAGAATVTVVVPGSVMHAVEGVNMGNDGMLYGASVHGQAVYRIDPRTGAVAVEVGSPEGEADDVDIGPVGTPAAGIMAWTAQTTGEIRIRRPGSGKVEVVLPNVPRVNPIAFNKEGRLFTAQVGAGDDTLWEVDVIGNKPPRVVAKSQGRLNGFGFGPDGLLYAPHFGTDGIFAINVDTGEHKVIATGVGAPAGVKVDPKGNVYSVNYLNGDVWRTDPKSGQSVKVTTVREPPDNLTIAADGTIYIANVADSAIYALDPATGKARIIVDGKFTIALGMASTRFEGRDAVLVADPFGYRFMDPKSGTVTRPFWAQNRGASSAVAADDRFIAYSYALSGRVRKIDRTSDQLVLDSKDIKAPRGVALTADGDVLVADAAAGRLVRLGAGGVTDIATGLKQPVALWRESESAVVVTEFDSGSITRVDLKSGRATQIATGFKGPSGLARMADGRWAVVEAGEGRVTAVDEKSGAREILAKELPTTLAGLHMPANTNAGISVGVDGALYVACPRNNSVVRIDP
jgi:sugar lactone lactonase YvrE